MENCIFCKIIAKQIPHAFGKDRDDKGVITELFEYGNEDWHELLIPLQNIEIGVFATPIKTFNLSLHPHACTKSVLQHAIDNVNKLADGKCWIFFRQQSYLRPVPEMHKNH